MLPLLPLLVFALQDSTHARTVRVRVVPPERAAAESVRAEQRRQALAAALPDAFADPDAERLVANARAQRERAERLVTRYQATVSQRIGAGLRALRRDRLLFGQEVVARIDWRRDGRTSVEVVGARQRVPVAMRGDSVPDLDDFESLVFDPAADYLRVLGDNADGGGFVHPLAAGAEASYRYATGDTTTITIPDGRTLRVVELRVQPRRAEFRLMIGSLWFDADTWAMVRAVFRPARRYEFRLDSRDEDEDLPRWINPKAEVRYVTMEYGLYEQRWWLPRFWAIDAEAEMSGVRMPLRFERVYSAYRVEGGGEPDPAARPPAGSVSGRRERAEGRTAEADSLRMAVRDCTREEAERLRREAREQGARQRSETVQARRICRERILPNEPWGVDVLVPGDDTLALLASPELGDPILSMGDVITESELRSLAREIGAIPQRPWQVRVQLPTGVAALFQQARYNRIEGPSFALRGTFDFGRLELDASGRLGVADLTPGGEVTVARPGLASRWSLAAYRRLAAANPDTRPLGPVNSLSALLLGRDDGEYFRSYGVELRGTAAPTRHDWWSLRIFGERQRPAAVETNASLPYLFDRGQLFRPNIVAAHAEQLGAALSVRGQRQLGGAAVLSGDASLEGSSGTFDFAKAGATARLSFPVLGRAAGLEVAAGTSRGVVPVQSQWFLGGSATLRGYDGGAIRGEAFWRVRAEAGGRNPAARLVVFGDAGWAGPRSGFGEGRALPAAGVGASLLDGILRFDVARGLRAPGGWRFDFYLDGVF
jgi:hypothetical protein